MHYYEVTINFHNLLDNQSDMFYTDGSGIKTSILAPVFSSVLQNQVFFVIVGGGADGCHCYDYYCCCCCDIVTTTTTMLMQGGEP